MKKLIDQDKSEYKRERGSGREGDEERGRRREWERKGEEGRNRRVMIITMN